MRIKPSAATVAGPDPLTAPQKVATATVAMAKPPVMSPTRFSTRRTMRAAIPALSIMKPAKIKKGIARRGTFATPGKEVVGQHIDAHVKEPADDGSGKSQTDGNRYPAHQHENKKDQQNQSGIGHQRIKHDLLLEVLFLNI